jgi:hypothetical protein
MVIDVADHELRKKRDLVPISLYYRTKYSIYIPNTYLSALILRTFKYLRQHSYAFFIRRSFFAGFQHI